MLIKEAVEKRIVELCNEREIAINALANISGVSPSTVYSILNEKSKNPGVCSIKKICDGLDISIREFFNSDLKLWDTYFETDRLAVTSGGNVLMVTDSSNEIMSLFLRL